MKTPYIKLKYVWLDKSNNDDTLSIREKTKIIFVGEIEWTKNDLPKAEMWVEGSVYRLNPVHVLFNPLESDSYIVFCETLHYKKDLPTKLNNRALAKKETNKKTPIYFEQEYLVLKDGKPINVPSFSHQYSPPIYSGVGAEYSKIKEIIKEHTNTCLNANIKLVYTNVKNHYGGALYELQDNSPINAADNLWISRYFLLKIAEKYNYDIIFNPRHISKKYGKFRTILRIKFNGLQDINKFIFNINSKLIYSSKTGKGEARLSKSREGYITDDRAAGDADPYDMITKIHEIYHNNN